MVKKYYIVTFGCQANESDSERIAGWYEKRGWRPAEDRYQADEIVFNTCSVRQSAEDRVIGQIHDLVSQKHFKPIKHLKPFKRRPLPKIILTGCMTRLGKSYLKKKIPGINEIWSIGRFNFKVPTVRKKKNEALVPIMTGCDNYCTYCVVPYARGREKSRPVEEILCEVNELVKRGYHTVMLLGQNVNSYKKSEKFQPEADSPLAKKIRKLEKKYQNNFAILLALVHDIKGIKKIKFLSSNPQDLSDGIIKAISLPKVDRTLHLPLQSGDDTVLKRMNRKYTVKKYLNLVKKIKKAIPDIRFSTDIIVGFPGETKKQFQNTVKVCKQLGFVRVYVARYSPRPQTAAYQLKDNIPAAEKKRRWQILNRLINQRKK